MAKLIMVLAFTALVAIVSAYRPIVTTTTTLIEVGNSKQQCSQLLQGQRFNQCQTYINNSRMENRRCCSPKVSFCWKCMINTEGQQGQMEQCCNELRNVEKECQCEAMQEVYKQAQQQQQWSQQDLQQIVQNLGNQCNLQVQQCRIPSAAMF